MLIYSIIYTVMYTSLIPVKEVVSLLCLYLIFALLEVIFNYQYRRNLSAIIIYELSGSLFFVVVYAITTKIAQKYLSIPVPHTDLYIALIFLLPVLYVGFMILFVRFSERTILKRVIRLPRRI
ncbi:MAG: hypothetical protein JW801_09250 [Bacteroidales bacterium]|nr:hypothetical protein [Bacteroidales bacterium]